jgi:hypothetical protein
MSDVISDEQSAKLFTIWKTLKTALNDAQRTIAAYNPALSEQLGEYEKVAWEIDGNVSLIPCTEAIQYALNNENNLYHRVMGLQSVSQAILNAISKYDDIHDWHDVHFDPNERGANHKAAVRTNVLEKELNAASIRFGIKKKTGSIELLERAVADSIS